jgi:hypothetical protein
MSHYIFLFQGAGSMPADDVAAIRAQPGITVLDEAPRMLLVEAPEAQAQSLAAQMPNWQITPERMYPLPDPRVKLRESEQDGEDGAPTEKRG